MALGDQAARGVDNRPLSAVSNVSIPYQLMRLPFLREPQPLKQNQLIARETIVQLADVDILGRDIGLLERLLRCDLRHAEADKVHGGFGEEARLVRGELLACDEDGLVLKPGAGVQEALGADDGGTGAVAGGRALELGDGVVDHGRVLNFFEGVLLLELGVGVALGVFVGDAADFCEILGAGAVSRRGC